MRSKRLQFTGSLGYKLSALLDLPDGTEPVCYAVFAHCFTCNKNYKILNNINQALSDNNIGILRFDFTGLGASQGSFGETTFSTNIEDIVAAARLLEINNEAPKLLIGHSFGGVASLFAAHRLPSCRAVVTIGSISNLDSIRQLLSSKRQELEDAGEATFSILGRQFRVKKQFLADLEQKDMKSAVANLNKALLIIHSPDDEIVPIENAHEIFGLARHPKSLISIDGADHLLSDERDGKYVGQLIATWASKYLKIIKVTKPNYLRKDLK